MADVDRYLWSVYERTEVKRDSTGNFTWKDALAAFRMNMALETYVIGGMDPDFRELLYHAGHAMDEAGLHWTILSGFRDDYRQSLATGYKARTDNSLHGGSVATGGYGHGCAADIVSADGPPDACGNGSTPTAPRPACNACCRASIRRMCSRARPGTSWRRRSAATASPEERPLMKPR